MKKSVAITTIVAFHAAVLSVLLVQAGCSSEPAEPKAGSAKATAEIVKSTDETVVSQEPKEVQIPEGSPALRVAPTRPIVEESQPMTDKEIASDTATPKSDINEVETVKPATSSVETKKAETKDKIASVYVVKKGDYLSTIAKKHNISLNALMTANGLNRSSIIKIGQEINIPAVDGAEVMVKEAKPQTIDSASMPTQETSIYIVKKGDSLSRIATNYKMKVSQLMAINNLKNHNIRVGQKLHIAKGATSETNTVATNNTSKQAKHPTSALAGEVAYTIKSGDNLGSIASKHGTSVGVIAERNSIADPRKIRVGQVIFIKSKAVASTPKANVVSKPAAATQPPVTVQTDATSTTPAVQPELKVEELKPVVEQPKVEDSNPPVIEL